ncbi:VPLPA-CTERM sorting domain-containing protein [Ovoidimarina sediminis]|uniref:VPLPA-CTERM sorting domain-containing protein n=1 Tax=Ovoidimarina sediminis TaxID=3079856 RepID=UPI00290E696D|nr:VPLPA-CTERM sorting domain-containing protein [Rhodophyticola sp. MJ-SS7]MDU8944898.1 VPLPA-CTERM sorting domain-containing protein [Rhodophyticola sp. MJ-SS7]
MKLSNLLAGAIIAMFPFAVSAATVSPDINPVGSNSVEYDFGTLAAEDNFSDEDIDLADGNDSYIIEFVALPESGSLSIDIINTAQRLLRTFVKTDLVINGSGAGSYDLYFNDVLLTTAIGDEGAFLADFTGTGTLKYVWTLDDDNDGQVSTNLTPSAVPLPASALLMLGALGGLAAIRRKIS